MNPTNELIHLAINNAGNPVAIDEIKAVMRKLMDGEEPTYQEMQRISVHYQRDPVLCTLDYQEFQDFVNSKFE